MIVGLILALGMGGLLIALLDSGNGDIVALLFMFGVLAGIIVVVAAALSGSDKE
jgi:hypothetical protein